MKIGATAGIGFDAATNAPALIVLGTTKNDKIDIDEKCHSDNIQVEIGRDKWSFSPDSFAGIIAVGYDGNDQIDLSGVDIDAAIYGGKGNDKLTGGKGDDYLDGGDGNDKLDGGKGSDTMVGGGGNDQFYAGLNEGDVLVDFGYGRDTAKTKKNK